MVALQNLIFGFVFSFIGSIPPGSINICVIELSLKKRYGAALRFGLAAAMVEFVYAAIAIKFQMLITSSPAIQDNFKLISAIVLLLLGMLSLAGALRKPKKRKAKETGIAASGFRKGILISLANPLAMPFWIAVTAYLQSNAWVNLTDVSIWSYVSGISLGTLAILSLLAVTAYRATNIIQQDNKIVKLVPGVVLLVLGLYSLGKLILA